MPYLKEERQSAGLSSNQLEEIAHPLETELMVTKEQLQNEKKRKTKLNKEKRRTYKKYLRKIQAYYLPRKQKYETYNHCFKSEIVFLKQIQMPHLCE